ncbi:MAG: hypothetical protein ACKPJJ_06695, partial [Planctomycetaceae bacterium]
MSDGTTVDADVLTIGGQNASAFAGVNGGTANAAGLSLSGVNFGFAAATDRLDGQRRWKTLQATAGTVAVVGIPDVTIEGTNLGISINRADANGVVYSKIPKLSFPVDKEGRSLLVQDVTYYSKAALYDPFKAWRDGGP